MKPATATVQQRYTWLSRFFAVYIWAVALFVWFGHVFELQRGVYVTLCVVLALVAAICASRMLSLGDRLSRGKFRYALLLALLTVMMVIETVFLVAVI